MSWASVGQFLKSKYVREQSPIMVFAVLILGGLAHLVFVSFPEERRETREWMGQLNEKNQTHLAALTAEFRDETKDQRATFEMVHKADADKYQRLVESMLKIDQKQEQTMNLGDGLKDKRIRDMLAHKGLLPVSDSPPMPPEAEAMP